MSDPQDKLPERPASVTGLRLTSSQLTGGDAPPSGTHAPDPAGSGLRVVTIAPARSSFADTEVPTNQTRLREDRYLGATVDGRYKVEALLGEGGMGVVYRCTHTIIGKKVAMKVLRADLACDTEVTERFLNEAKSASAIGNPHIIDISDFGQFPDGATYFVMEYLAGSPLSKAITEGSALPVPRILHIAQQLAEALSAAHAAGIVHRDLKPDNIFLIDRGGHKDFIKILDFGIAKVSTTGEGKLTRAGAVFGTPHYMSPEQAAGTTVDHRGDIYSLGVILYEMASGRVPFDADNFMGILTQHMYKAPVPMSALVPKAAEVPPGLEAIVLKCLSKRPEDRYPHMQDLLADLRELSLGNVPRATHEMLARSAGLAVPANYFSSSQKLSAASPEVGARIAKRKRWLIAFGLAAALAGAATLIALFSPAPAGTAHGSDPALVLPEPRQPATTAPTATQPVSPSPAPEPRTQRVVVAVEPLDARVFHGEVDLGQSPVMLDVREGESVELVARRTGYKETTLTVDGSIPRSAVKLERAAPTSQPRAPARPKAALERASEKPKRRTPGSGEIVNPWD